MLGGLAVLRAVTTFVGAKFTSPAAAAAFAVRRG